MKTKSSIFTLFTLINAPLLLLVGCSGSQPKPVTSDVPVTLTMHDAAPTGVTVLAFGLQLTGVSLQSVGANAASASLLSSPVTIQLQDLETTNELLANSSAPAGTYTSLMVTFAGASVTILNSSGQALTVGGQSCAAAQICQFQPTLNQMSSTSTTAPFPLTLIAGQAVTIALDFNIASSLQGNLTVTPTVTTTASTAALQDGNLADFSGVTGQITAVGNNQFTLVDGNTGRSLTLSSGIDTTFNGFTGCAANNFTCVQTNQIATVNFGVDTTSAQTLTASNVSLAGNFTKAITGTVISTNLGQNQATVVVTGESPTIPGVAIGQQIIVSPNAGATFGISAAGATIPNNLLFQQASDLIVGQSIMFDGSSVTAGTIPTVSTGQIQLVPTQFSGTVSTVSGNNVMVNGLNGAFTMGGISQIQVQTGTQTQFQNVTGVSGLTAGNNVSLGGFLFNTPSGPVLVGQQVFAPPPTA